MTLDDSTEALVDAALAHVPFDGWSDETFRAAIDDSGVSEGLARVICPRGGLDLALAFHRRGDRAMVLRAEAEDLGQMRYSERVAALIRFRIEAVAAEKEAVRRGTTLFALPINAAEGARAIWGTADAIWTVLGDTSRDINWYTKRATLSAVYGAVVLFWLGDQSEGNADTWAFLDRRIAEVLRFEGTKARIRRTPLGKAFAKGPGRIFDRIRAPEPRGDLPGVSGR